MNPDAPIRFTIANAPLAGQIVFQHSSTTRMTTAKQYDYLNRLISISSSGRAPLSRRNQVKAESNPISFNYTYNAASQTSPGK